MANQYLPHYTPTPMSTPPQQLFPQPQGSVYLINNSLEVANIPIGARMVGIIEDYKKTKSPSECMLEMWNEFKEDYIQEAAHIKMMQDIYKMTK